MCTLLVTRNPDHIGQALMTPEFTARGTRQLSLVMIEVAQRITQEASLRGEAFSVGPLVWFSKLDGWDEETIRKASRVPDERPSHRLFVLHLQSPTGEASLEHPAMLDMNLHSATGYQIEGSAETIVTDDEVGEKALLSAALWHNGQLLDVPFNTWDTYDLLFSLFHDPREEESEAFEEESLEEEESFEDDDEEDFEEEESELQEELTSVRVSLLSSQSEAPLYIHSIRELFPHQLIHWNVLNNREGSFAAILYAGGFFFDTRNIEVTEREGQSSQISFIPPGVDDDHFPNQTIHKLYFFRNNMSPLMFGNTKEGPHPMQGILFGEDDYLSSVPLLSTAQTSSLSISPNVVFELNLETFQISEVAAFHNAYDPYGLTEE